MSARLGTALAVTLFALPTLALADSTSERIVSIGGATTEIVYALGQQDRLVARDTTSVYPEAALDLPDIGYMRRLSPEGVLSVDPDLILTEPGSGPLEAIEILRGADIEFVEVPGGYDAPGILSRIDTIAAELGVPDAGATLHAQVAQDLADAMARAESAYGDGPRPRVMFILSMPGGRVNAAGLETRPDGIIQMAGAENALPDFTQYRVLTDEAIISAAPDVILMMQRDDHAAQDEELWSHPAISLTPAGENQAIVRMNGAFMLGFGPRTADAVVALSEALANIE